MQGTRSAVVIVAGGAGSRMGSAVPKQFLLLGGKPVLMHSVEAFYHAVPGIRIVVVLPEAEFERWNRLCEEFKFSIPHLLAKGGETRFHSVRNGLAMAGDADLVAIHDAARPLVPVKVICESFRVAGEKGACVPVLPLADSVRRIEGDNSVPVDRTVLRAVQTPQVFRTSLILNAYRQPFRESFTDDATVAEGAGAVIGLTDGDPVNFKITNPDDLIRAEAFLRRD